jgi:hypothetical protein
LPFVHRARKSFPFSSLSSLDSLAASAELPGMILPHDAPYSGRRQREEKGVRNRFSLQNGS